MQKHSPIMENGASSKGAGMVTFSDPIDDSKLAKNMEKKRKLKEENVPVENNATNGVDCPDEHASDDANDGSNDTATPRYIYWLNVIIPIVTHGIAIWVYFAPIYYAELQEKVLDEIHILSDGFADVQGTSPWMDVFKNDYWGRPMSMFDSHKSWRPFSVLLFRWLNLDVVNTTLDRVFVHRYVRASMLHYCCRESYQRENNKFTTNTRLAYSG